MTQARPRHAIAAAFLLGVGASWNGGNVGPAVDELSREFGVSLATVGLLSGTVFFAAVIVAVLAADGLARRAGFAWALRITCITAGLGNVIFAVSPDFAGLAAGRVISGFGTGLAFVLAPVFAHALGGVKLVGAVGAAMQLGVAAALGIGSVIYDSGVDWRVGFALSALIGFSALPLLPWRFEADTSHAHPRHLLRIELRDPDLWRVTALFIATLTVPLVLGAWLIHYLVSEGLEPGLAGALTFILFGFSASMRFVGGRLSGTGVSPSVIGGLTPLLAAAGIVLLALEPSETLVVLLASLLTGAGFALTFALLMTEGQWILPADPVAPLALMTLVNNAIPIVAIPVLGVAFASGDGETALFVLAAVVAFGALLNLAPPRRQIGPGASAGAAPAPHNN